jgi:hypothetical protein
MNMRRAVAIAVTALFVSPPPPASAHQEMALHALSVIDAVTPAIPGLSFRVVQITQPVLFARNHTDETLVVYGERGEPFLRLKGGRVQTNLNSPLTYVSRDPMGQGASPTDLAPDASPRWSTLAKRDSWSWFDPRIRYSGAGNHTWEVAARLGDREVVITGRFEPLIGHGHFDTEIEAPPSIPDLEIRLLDGLVPAMYVRNATRRTLRVPGRHNEPFLKIGPRGVFGNSRSPDYYLGGTQTVRRVPASADPSARPRWDRLSEVPIWSWLEYRARLPAAAHERSTLGTERKVILTWVTPLELGRARFPIRGRVEWIPPRAASPSGTGSNNLGIWLSAVAALLIAAGAAVIARKQRASVVGT